MFVSPANDSVGRIEKIATKSESMEMVDVDVDASKCKVELIGDDDHKEDENTADSNAADADGADCIVPAAPLLSQKYEMPPVSHHSDASMTVSLWVTWIIPLIVIAIFSRRVVDTTIPTIQLDEPASRPSAQLKLERKINQERRQKNQKRNSPAKPPAHNLLQSQDWSVDYKQLVESIYTRRRPINGFPGGIHTMVSILKRSSQQNKNNEVEFNMNGDATIEQTEKLDHRRHSNSRTRSGNDREIDPLRAQYLDTIDGYRAAVRRDPDDIYQSIALAEAMRMYDLQFHEGGTFEQESLALYDAILATVTRKRQDAQSAGKVTNQSANINVHTVNDEVMLDFIEKSLDGLVCALYTSQGKLYFMANMFERSYDAYSFCLNNVDSNYLDAVNARGSTAIVLGRYAEAARDFLQVIRHEAAKPGHFLFIEAYTGLARVLETKEDVVPDGWDSIVDLVHNVISTLTEHMSESAPQDKPRIAGSLNRLHHVLFTYHDSKTKNYRMAFDHLTRAYTHKLSVLPPWVSGSEQTKIIQTKNIFQRGFWPDSTGSRTQTPIFIIGFIRSGSTLLERILDAHPLITGTGENSVFNGRLNDIRNQIVKASTSASQDELAKTTRRLANEVVSEMYERWDMVQANTNNTEDNAPRVKPKRLADKMLTNYYNVGFIQLLYPNALILHVAREPMDSVFSAYKHEFPPGSLDYTSDSVGVTDLYHAYRDVMDHWDEALPGRITHIRYEDMVKDFENVARAIIKATGLAWDDSVLEFHKKKHAVNTMSSTQVRKGIYTSSLNSWMRYEEELQPIVKLLGDHIKYNLKTTIPGYVAKEPLDDSDE